MFSEISNLMYRFQMGIKEISPRFTRRNDSSLGILSSREARRVNPV
jgi:hypothetical protein